MSETKCDPEAVAPRAEMNKAANTFARQFDAYAEAEGIKLNWVLIDALIELFEKFGESVEAEARRRALAEIRPSWQPIETAPKDGTEVLLTDGQYKHSGYWAKRIGVWSVNTVVVLNMPTHWIPLPDPPATRDLAREELV